MCRRSRSSRTSERHHVFGVTVSGGPRARRDQDGAGMAAETPQENPRNYDVYFRADGGWFSLRLADHGITLSDARIDWVADGQSDAARLDSIVAVHLQTGGTW